MDKWMPTKKHKPNSRSGGGEQVPGLPSTVAGSGAVQAKVQMNQHRQCISCSETKLLTEFRGLSSVKCRSCVSATLSAAARSRRKRAVAS